MTTTRASQCPEGALVDGAVILCGRDGGHEGNHVGAADRGIAEWPRIKATPLADWERELICDRCRATHCATVNCSPDHETPF